MSTYQLIHSGTFYKGVDRNLKSKHYPTTYAVGSVVTADSLDQDVKVQCSHGIHVCRSIAEALAWGPVVVEVTIPDGATLVDAGKLRTTAVKVEKIANLTGALLYGANLTGACLYEADLSRAYLTGANLSGANLTRANLARAYLTRANLTGACLYGAYLTRADLTRADLSGADLSRANLTGACLYGAYLTRADLTRADLSRANLSGANLSGAYGNSETVLPAGWKVNDSGLIVKAD